MEDQRREQSIRNEKEMQAYAEMAMNQKTQDPRIEGESLPSENYSIDIINRRRIRNAVRVREQEAYQLQQLLTALPGKMGHDAEVALQTLLSRAGF